MSSPTGIKPKGLPADPVRVPLPVLTPLPFGGFQMSCRSCPVRIAGLPDQETAQRWADRHQCSSDPCYRLDNHAWTPQVRGDNGGLFNG